MKLYKTEVFFKKGKATVYFGPWNGEHWEIHQSFRDAVTDIEKYSDTVSKLHDSNVRLAEFTEGMGML